MLRRRFVFAAAIAGLTGIFALGPFQNCSKNFESATSPSIDSGSSSEPGSSNPPPAPTPVSPSGAKNCALNPNSCGYPDATNTGIEFGVTLQRVPQDVSSGTGWHYDSRGWISVDTDGAVFNGYSVDANIDVTANNVTISNVRSTVGGETFGISLRHTQNVTVRNCEIGPPDIVGRGRLLVAIKDIYGDADGTQILKNNIYHASTGIQVYAGLVKDNYVHDMGYNSGDHVNGLTVNGGTTPMTIQHNTIFNQLSQTDAISLFQDFGVEANKIIDDNLIAGGGYTIYAGGGDKGVASHIQVTNNRISRIYFPNGGDFGPATAYEPAAPGNVWSGNVWDDTNAVIPAP